MHVKQYVPNFVDTDRRLEADVDTLEQLLALPWIEHWQHDEGVGFRRYSVSRDSIFGKHLLMVEVELDKPAWYVISMVEGDEVLDLLPAWKHP
jgi:hypothetical protein